MRTFNRSAAAVAISGAVLLGVPGAAHAQGVTNPAQHPAPITVTIDGQTYHDGLDTLPGYDDYACTPIPNVQYAFADDEIQYYNGQNDLVTTAHWTEWSRISSYDDWVAQQNAGTPTSTPTPAPTTASSTGTSPAATTPATTSPAATSPATTRPATTSPAAKTHSSVTKTKSSATKTTSSPTKTTSTATTIPAAQSTPKQAAPSHASKSGAPAKDKSTAAAAAPVATATPGAPSSGDATPAPTVASASPTPQTAPKYKLVSERTAVGSTRGAGEAILAAIAALAALAFLFGWANRPDFARRGIYTDTRG